MAYIREAKEIVVVLENNLANLARISEAIGNSGINIEAINAYEKEGNAYIRILTPDPESAKNALKVHPGEVIETKVVIVRLIDRPGELGKVAKRLSQKLLNIESLYIVGKDGRYTEVAIKPKEEDYEKVKEILS